MTIELLCQIFTGLLFSFGIFSLSICRDGLGKLIFTELLYLAGIIFLVPFTKFQTATVLIYLMIFINSFHIILQGKILLKTPKPQIPEATNGENLK